MAQAPGGLAEAIDRKIRSVVGPLIASSIVRLQEELVAALGGMAAPAAQAPGRRPGRPPGRRTRTGRNKPSKGHGATCNLAGCTNPQRSKGYCSKHYQAARTHGWPMPAPQNFSPLTKPGRPGRPAKTKAAPAPVAAAKRVGRPSRKRGPGRPREVAPTAAGAAAPSGKTPPAA